MSASDKKKLRKEQAAAKMTERQRQEQAEAKKLKIYTISFIVVIALVIVAALSILVVQNVKNYAILEKWTTAAVVGDRELNSPEMNYYLVDAVNEMYNDWISEGGDSQTADYLEMLGWDPKVALNKQTNPETEKPWSDYFLNVALENAQSDFAMCDLAKKDGFTLPEDAQAEVDSIMTTQQTYADIYTGGDLKALLKQMYGNGADGDTFREYCERRALASAYSAHKHETIVAAYDDAAIRAYEADKMDNYTTYEYTSAYLSISDFRTGDASNVEEENAAREALKAAAEDMATATSIEELETKAAAIEPADDTAITVSTHQRFQGSVLKAIYADLATWICSEERTEEEIGLVPVVNKTEDADGNEVENINGYYVIIFHKVDDNTSYMGNVRHLLVEFVGGTEDEETLEMTYSDEEKAETKAKAEELLAQWESGAKTEESFVELLMEHSADTGKDSNEGLYENINADSTYVDNFQNWAIDPDRKVGDVEIVETEYGYHIMYFVGHSEMTYRDTLITSDMGAEDHDTWYTEAVAAVSASIEDTSYLLLDLVMET